MTSDANSASKWSNDSPKRSKWPFVLGGLALICGLVVYRTLHPYDEVAVHVLEIPPGTEFLCIVSQTSDGVRPMDWSLSKGLPFSMHPDDCTVSYCDGTAEFRARVRWIDGKRVGVLLGNVDQTWAVSWCETTTPNWRLPILGGGRATFDISRHQPTDVDAESVREMGLEAAFDREW